jgi:predicted nucleic acid-binding protein
MTVLDASAAISLLLAGADRDSPRFEGDFEAPDLFLVEVANGIRRTEQSGAISVGMAEVALADLLEIPVELTSSRDLVERAFELRANVTIMDGCYVALAEQLGCGVLTADRRLARAPGLTVPFTLV